MYRHITKLHCYTSLLFTLAMVASATGAEWGNLKGRLVVEGDVADPAPINVNKDTEYCSQHDVVSETAVVGDGGGLANAFIYLYLKRGASVEAHPDSEAAATETAVLDNKGCRFEPHAMIVRTGQPFEVHNSDPGIGHNTNAKPLENPPFNQIVPNDSPLEVTFQKSESFPTTFSCNVHPWMNAYVLIRDNPYMAVTAADGSFEIANLPAGKHEFAFWHESPGRMKNVVVGDAGKTSRKGQVKLEIPAGDTLDLGDITVPASLLAP